MSLSDSALVEQFLADTAPRLKAALADPTPLHAVRTERMFEATVLSLGRFRQPDGGLRLTMVEAVTVNEFARLGDVSIGTKPPLRLVFDATTDKPRRLGAEGLAEFTIGSEWIYSGEVELTDPRNRRLAEILFLFGEWSAEGATAIVGNDGIAEV